VKILRFDDDKIGVLKNDSRVVDVSAAIENRESKGPQRVMEEVITSFGRYRSDFERVAAREEGVPVESVRLLAPIPRPGKCLGAFLNYMDQPGRSPDSLPLEFFYKDPSLLGPGGTIELADIPQVTEYQTEAELAFVIGKAGRHIRAEDGMDHVFGFVPFFDISVRGITRYTRFLTKGQVTHGPCGPWITTKDEVPDPHDRRVRSWVNGVPAQDFTTGYMAHKIPAQVAWLSRFVQLDPGDVIATGTYHEGRKGLRDGDVLEIEIEGMGKARFIARGQWFPRPGAASLSQTPRAPGVADASTITHI
jgi:2-keto-4-pentenoate hydratase/2-oxohepta-3-ene-1,7-dioic acid hydratase in catechol pathway